MSDPRVIYLGPACEADTGDGRTWAEDDPWPTCDCGHQPVRYVLGEDFDRVTAERDALQQRLTTADQRLDELEQALKFYAEREHYHFESGNWDTVSGEPLNILWCGDEPDFIEDGSVARAALSASAEPAKSR